MICLGRRLLILTLLLYPLSEGMGQGVGQLTVPDGFTVEKVAGPPLVRYPMMANFDERGRLYVAESAGMNLRANELEEQLPNLIRRLEDTDGDGIFDKSTVFADKMTLPMGALWYRGALYVASPPNIWKLEDTDDDGVADVRQVIVSKFGYTGNAASIHGCFLGPCGRIYWCDGRHGHEFRDEKGNIVSQGLAARIFSCKPDGSDVEVFCGGGMDNPVEVTFTSEGEMLGTVAIFLSRPQRRDALVHWMYGGAYPHHPCVSEFKRTGDLLGPVSLFGQVAPAGVMRYRDDQFGSEYANNIFLAQFNTHKVVRTVIERSGSTYRSTDEDFFVSDSIDFHPTDVLQDADGSLLVIDTGGWFRIGCPLSQIAKPEVLGGIYRIRKAGQKPPADPRGFKLDFATLTTDELVGLLDDERFVVRDRALDTLAQRGSDSISALQKALENPSTRVRRNAVWALSRIGSSEATAVLHRAANDTTESVQLAAVHSLAVLRDAQALPILQRLIIEATPPVRREAATALGRIGNAEAVPAILQSLNDPVDRLLEHALIYALIEIDDRESTLPGLSATSPQVRRASLIALDQMDHGQLTRELVTPLLDTTDPLLQQAALEVITRHEGWSGEIIRLLSDWLKSTDLTSSQQAMARGALLAFIKEDQIQTLMADALAAPSTPPAVKQLLLEVIQRSALESLPTSWQQALSQLLKADDEWRLQTVVALTSLSSPQLDDQMRQMLTQAELADELRIAVLNAMGKRLKEVDARSFAALLSRLSPQTAILDRLKAAEVLSKLPLADGQLMAVAPYLSQAEPLELPALAEAFANRTSPEVGTAFVRHLASAPGLSSLPAARLRTIVSSYPQAVQSAAEPLLQRLEAQSAMQQSRMLELQPALAHGDPARGKELFFGKRAACFACHKVQGEGGAVGPDLSKIGEIRNANDLLEAIVFPSATFARGYESYSVATVDGRVLAGIIARETPDAIFLIDAQRSETRIARDDVEQMAPSKVSIMPQGFDTSLSPNELADLVAFLQSLK